MALVNEMDSCIILTEGRNHTFPALPEQSEAQIQVHLVPRPAPVEALQAHQRERRVECEKQVPVEAREHLVDRQCDVRCKFDSHGSRAQLTE